MNDNDTPDKILVTVERLQTTLIVTLVAGALSVCFLVLIVWDTRDEIKLINERYTDDQRLESTRQKQYVSFRDRTRAKLKGLESQLERQREELDNNKKETNE